MKTRNQSILDENVSRDVLMCYSEREQQQQPGEESVHHLLDKQEIKGILENWHRTWEQFILTSLADHRKEVHASIFVFQMGRAGSSRVEQCASLTG